MLTKAKIKLIRSLFDKEGRREHGLFVAEGSKTVNELLASKIRLKTLFATKRWIEDHVALIKNVEELIEVSSSGVKQISALKTPQEAVAVLELPENRLDDEMVKQTLTLVLDTIQDPGNMGTIIRIADWYGIPQVICSPKGADPFGPKVIQATMGSFVRVNCFVSDPATCFGKHKNIPVYGAGMHGENLYRTTISTPAFLIIGNEGSGISKELEPFISHTLSIPGRGGAESLNAGVAAAVICDAWARSLEPR